MKWLALDIGGANVKVADGQGYAQSYMFHLWKAPAALAQQIRTAISEAPQSDHLAVTMTGELADCFETKAAGVRFILKAVGDGCDNRHTRVYLTDGRLVTPQIALTMPQLVGASNWHALAKFAGRFAPSGSALMIDVGSTTCDIIPLRSGLPTAAGRTDTERLISGELVYTGVERTPVCAVVDEVPYRNLICPVVQEVFATMRDVHILLDDLPEEMTSHSTADGKPATKAHARMRLGRMIAADEEAFNHRDAVQMAQAIADAQGALLSDALDKVKARMPAAPTAVVLSGHGEFLARAVLAKFDLQNVKLISLARELGFMTSRCAPAHALAVLAREAASR